MSHDYGDIYGHSISRDAQGRPVDTWGMYTESPSANRLMPGMVYEGSGRSWYTPGVDEDFLVTTTGSDTSDYDALTSGQAGAYADPAFVAAQRAALDRLQSDVGLQQAGYWLPDTLAKRNQILGAQRQLSSGYAGGLAQQMEARGQLGANTQQGLDAVLAQQQATQGSVLDAQVEQSARARALQDLQRYNDMTARMRGQQYSEEMARRQALDQWNRYNMQYQRDVHGRDVDRQTQESADRADARQQEWENRRQLTETQAGNTRQENQQEYDIERQQRDHYNRYWNMYGNMATSMIGGAAGGGGDE